MKHYLYFLFVWLVSSNLIAQDGVGINTDNPDPSALLDVTSTSQGVLIPRMTNGERDLIASPARGLLIYSTTTNTFWYYNSSSWIEIASSVSRDVIVDADNDTRVEVERTADDDIIRFTMRNTEYFTMEDGRLNVLNTGNSVFFGNLAGRSDDLSNNNNTFIGANAGQSNNTGFNNTAVGRRALRNNTVGTNNVVVGTDGLRRNESGSYNIAIGSNASEDAISADSNIAIGFNALQNHLTGNNNIAFGLNTLQDNITGSGNVAIGNNALENNTNGNNNTAIGRLAGRNATGSGNVFIGLTAGQNETGDNKLYVDNSSTASPLIYGDFAADSLVINGDLGVQGNITYVGTITDISDRRLKEDFDTLKQVMHLVNRLNAYSYHMKDDIQKQREYGLIAQEVQKVFPEMVKVIDEEKGYIGVNYLQLVAILIEGLKEQQRLILNLEEKQSLTDERLNELKAQVKEIESLFNVKQ